MNELSPIGYFVTICLALFGARCFFALITDYGNQWSLAKRRANDSEYLANYQFWKAQEYANFVFGVLLMLALSVFGLGGAGYILFG